MEVVLVAGIAVFGAFQLLKPTGYKRKYSKGLPFRHALMSHRGGSNEHVENTLPAFRYSAKLRVDILEMDVQLTKDDQVVIFHDDYLGRMCGEAFKQRQISDYKFDELPLLVIPKKLDYKAESLRKDKDSTRIPLLTEVLNEFPKYPMQIDVKNGPEKLVIQVGKLLQRNEREEFTVWGSFKPQACNLCYKHFGKSIPLFFSAPRFLKALFLHRIGLMKWMEFRESALIVPGFKWLLSPSFISELNQSGISVIVFGTDGSGAINSKEEWAAVNASGANGICSDVPTELKEWLQSNPMKPTVTPFYFIFLMFESVH